MSKVMLDSTVVIDILRGRPGALARLRELQLAGDEPVICATVAFEVSVGVRPREREDATVLFEGLGALPLGVAEGRLAGWWALRHRQGGRTLSPSDCMIAAAAVENAARLATGNPKDFPMTELTVEHWPVGE